MVVAKFTFCDTKLAFYMQGWAHINGENTLCHRPDVITSGLTAKNQHDAQAVNWVSVNYSHLTI